MYDKVSVSYVKARLLNQKKKKFIKAKKKKEKKTHKNAVSKGGRIYTLKKQRSIFNLLIISLSSAKIMYMYVQYNTYSHYYFSAFGAFFVGCNCNCTYKYCSLNFFFFDITYIYIFLSSSFRILRRQDFFFFFVDLILFIA